MILFFPQYQAGYMPSTIPNGTDAWRNLAARYGALTEVPVGMTPAQPDQARIHNMNYRTVLEAQYDSARKLIAAQDPDFILTTGGDCGTAPASLAHLNRKFGGKVGFLWIDAHADIHSTLTSPSKNFHGMPLRWLLGDPAFDHHPDLPFLPHQIAFLGLRSTETEEDAVIQQHGMPRFSGHEVMASDAPLQAVLAHFQRAGLTHLHLHVDVDVMDPEVFPHVHVPAPGGLTVERLIEILQKLRAAMPLSGCCLTEYAPAGDPAAGIPILAKIYEAGFGLKPL